MGAVEPNFDRRVEAGQNLARTLGEGIRLLFGQVDASLNRAGKEVEKDQDGRHRYNADGGVKNGFECFFLHGSCKLAGTVTAQNDAGGEEREADQRQEKEQVA